MRDKTYKRLMQSQQWQELRTIKLANNPTCERCGKGGRIRAASVVHHIMPVETATSIAQAEKLCFSLTNLQSLCRECHAAIHNGLRYHSRDCHKERTATALDRWKDNHKI